MYNYYLIDFHGLKEQQREAYQYKHDEWMPGMLTCDFNRVI